MVGAHGGAVPAVRASLHAAAAFSRRDAVAAARLPVEPVAAGAGGGGEGAVGRRGLAPVDAPVAVEIEIAHHEGAAALGAAQLAEQLRHAGADEAVVAVAAVPVPAVLRQGWGCICGGRGGHAGAEQEQFSHVILPEDLE